MSTRRRDLRRPATSRHRRRPARQGVVATVSGRLGEVCVTLAVLLALFFVWQTWWTDLVANHQAEHLVAEFDRVTTPGPAEPASLRTDEPPRFEPVADGEMIGVLTVPRWQGLTRNRMPILEGTDSEILNQGAAGHYSISQQVGEIGNFALAGHRRTHGNSFRHIDDLQAGDAVVVETATTWYVYEVMTHEVVLPSQWEVVAAVPDDPDAIATERMLTLTTCHSPTRGEYGNTHRWVVHARLSGWLERSAGTPDAIVAVSA